MAVILECQSLHLTININLQFLINGYHGVGKVKILKILPFGNLKNFGKSSKYEKNDYGLLILMDLPRYSYYLYSCPISSTQVLSYFDDQIKFYNLLPYYIQKKLKNKALTTLILDITSNLELKTI